MTQNHDNIHKRIDALEAKVDGHIHDGIDVWKSLEALKNDLEWLKHSYWTLATAIVTFNVSLAILIIKLLFFK